MGDVGFEIVIVISNRVLFFMETQICSVCNKEKNVDDFAWKYKNKKRHCHCRLCQRIKFLKHYQENKQIYLDRAKKNNKKTQKRTKDFVCEYVKTHPCVDCGNSDFRVLEFDHVRGNKNFTIANRKSRCLSTVKKEISKCEVRCANCHRIRHYEENHK